MKLLNLGCGEKTSDRPGVVNVDWSAMLRLRTHPMRRVLVPVFLHGDRLARYRSLPDNILVHNLADGIPFESGSVDAVYHSHTLEHLDRDVAEDFVREVLRVLKPGGIHRIVVPDLELLCRNYVAHLDTCDADPLQLHAHDGYVAAMLEQSVRREAHGTSQQRPLRRRVEHRLLGDARRRGQTHQWMYDRVNLSALLLAAGYGEVHQHSHDSSLISDWNDYGLDLDAEGREYRPGSLYMEAVK
ncbi:methyltransferase domain-containing protein [Nocardioides immobilis]|uniref:Methyltransferase domain-containing protein n=1 Tax=Nocardioides immobilis TaxID=2049295 RepID=A0A417XSQ6_9ACTN|nr:class I SAM-dependent methyltransferase [Nocardioides immobilis]RHW23499.1 methyltransferase domain-containing protein [Nocardioides immobilis]